MHEPFHSKDETLRWIHLSDTHIPDSGDYVAWGEARPMVAAEETILRAAEIPAIDFLAHTGDVCDVHGIGNRKSYEKADALFGSLKLPRYFVTGNHDDTRLLVDTLENGPRQHIFHDSTMLCYQFTQKGVPFLVLDARVNTSATGYVSKEQQEWLEERLQQISPATKAVVLMHYPLFNDSVDWIRNKMLVQNADEVHALLSRYADRLVAVFHGHVHAAMQYEKNGVHYISAPSGSYPFDVSVGSTDCWIDPTGDVGFSVVTLSTRDWSVSIKQIHNKREGDHSFFGCVSSAAFARTGMPDQE